MNQVNTGFAEALDSLKTFVGTNTPVILGVVVVFAGLAFAVRWVRRIFK